MTLSTQPRQLKIIHLNMHHHWGGQPNRILTESLGLRDLGHEVWVAGPQGCLLVERARAAGLPTFENLELRRGFRPASFWRDLSALKALLRRERFDVVHPHGSQDAWLSAFAVRARSPRPALVRSRHNTFPIADHPFNRWLYKQFDWIITISPQVNHLVTQGAGYPAERITAIYSAPDPARFHPRPPDPALRAELGIPDGEPVVGMVARLAPEKGHHLLLGAAAIVTRDFPEARFVCAGKGRSRPDIERLARELGIEHNVILTGFRDDVPDVVALFDVFVLSPTSGESLGTSILEAFCMEKPAVATEVGGTGESVRDGQTGFLIQPAPEPLQIEGLAEAILKLLRDPDLRKSMGQAGRRLVEQEFHPRRLAERTAQLYQQLVTEKSKPSVGETTSTPV